MKYHKVPSFVAMPTILNVRYPSFSSPLFLLILGNIFCSSARRYFGKYSLDNSQLILSGCIPKCFKNVSPNFLFNNFIDFTISSLLLKSVINTLPTPTAKSGCFNTILSMPSLLKYSMILSASLLESRERSNVLHVLVKLP